MASDLLLLSIEMCGRKTNPTFPAWLKDNLVQHIMVVTLTIHYNVFIANQMRNREERLRLQTEAQALCTYLNQLIRIAYDKRWISDKQRDRWQRLTTSLGWKIYSWSKA